MTIKYPSIEQFKNAIRTVKDHTCYRGKDENGKAIYVDSPLPTIKFKGTVKIHGTNAGIRYNKETDQLIAQSRERDLSITSDNAGFCQYVLKHEEFFKSLLKSVIGEHEDVVLYGEWAGAGIQKGVAVCNIEKTFFMFGIRFKFDESVDTWADFEEVIGFSENKEEFNSRRIYSINQFETYEIDIDFNNPGAAQNKLVELTTKVEEECPVGKFFGHSGVGEGIVWSATDPNIGRIMFKVKGEAHSNSKVKTLAPVDEESFAAAKEFAETYTTQARLEQGLHVMKAEHQLEAIDKNVGHFIKWVTQDVMKEEQRAVAENDLDPKKIVREVSNIARKWYFEQL